MTFSEPWFLLAGAGLSGLVVIAFARRTIRSRRLADFLGGARAARRLARYDLLRVQLERILLLALASLAIALAAAGPRRAPPETGSDVAEPPEARRVMLAIDVSSSMQGTDAAPTRLGAAVRIAQDLVESMEGSEVGLLLVGGKGYALSPPTFDHRGLHYLLRGVTPTTASPWDSGSRLSVGIRQAVAELAGADDAGREQAIVLITDAATGEPEEDAVSAAREAIAGGVRLHTVGIASGGGTGAGGPDPREALLRRLAEIGGGSYTDGTEASQEVVPSRGPLGGLSRMRFGVPWSEEDATVWLTLAALLLLFADGLLDGPRRAGWRRPAGRAP